MAERARIRRIDRIGATAEIPYTRTIRDIYYYREHIIVYIQGPQITERVIARSPPQADDEAIFRKNEIAAPFGLAMTGALEVNIFMHSGISPRGGLRTSFFG